MLCRTAFLQLRKFRLFFPFTSRLACILVFALSQSLAWAEDTEVDVADDTHELEKFVVFGVRDEAIILEQSAAAVDVIDIKADQKLTADLSEILSREPGISIRRMGGLGSRERFFLNGLGDEQIRFFIDGVPLEMSGYTFGISSIPVNLIKRAEIYHGVVPIELGADSLGGAVNLITDKGLEGTGGSVSHMIGDFNTTRSTATLNYVDDSGFFSRFSGFYDYSDNNYEVDVSVPIQGKPEPYTGKRFHDAYEGKGANIDIGYTEQSWAELFQISFYTSEYYKENQHNIDMSTVYGEVTIDRKSYGLNLRYKQQLTDGLHLTATAGASEMKSHFLDVAEYSYLWTGEEVVTPTEHPGEIENTPCDCTSWRNGEYVISNLKWSMAQGHTLDFSISPSWHRQSAKDRLVSEGTPDIIDADRDMFSLVMGVNYTLDLHGDRFQNQLFVKRYSQDREAEQLSIVSKLVTNLESNINRVGWGNQARYKFYDWLIGKVSYEQATRLPSVEEVFGNSATIVPNIELDEEYSDNFNLSLVIDGLYTQYGSWKGGANVFLRDVEDAIFPMVVGESTQYQNISSVTSEGIQLSGSWNSPEDFIYIGANFTSFDLINTADDGVFEDLKDLRIPNRPYVFFNSTVGLKWMGVFSGYDELSLDWNYRIVDRFNLTWGNHGASQFTPYVPKQKSHSLATSYTKDIFPYTVTLSAEVQNMTNEDLFDYYGVQRPGRAYYVKAILDF